MAVRVERTVGGTSIAIDPRTREAKRLERELPGQISTYQKDVSQFEKEKREFLEKRKAYEARVKAWEQKYSPFLIQQRGKTSFGTKRQLPQRTVSKAYKSYRLEAKAIAAKQQALDIKQQQLVSKQQALESKAQTIGGRIQQYKQYSSVSYGKVRFEEPKQYQEAAQIVTGMQLTQIYPPPKEITTVEGTTPITKLALYKEGLKQKLSEKVTKFEERTVKAMPPEKAQKIALRVTAASEKKYLFAKTYLIPKLSEPAENKLDVGMMRVRRFQYGFTEKAVREPFKHPVKYGAIVAGSVASFGIGGALGVGAGIGSKFVAAGAGGYYAGTTARRIKEAPTLEMKGGEVGVTVVELGSVAAGYGIYKGGKVLTSISKPQVTVQKVYAKETLKPTSKTPGKFELSAKATVKRTYPFRLTNRVTTQQVDVSGYGTIKPLGPKTFTLHKLEFVTQAGKYPSITKGEMIGITQRLSKTELVTKGLSTKGGPYYKAATMSYVETPKEPTYIIGKDIIKRQAVVSGYGKEVTAYTSLGVKTPVQPAGQKGLDVGMVFYERPYSTAGTFIKTKGISGITGTISKVTTPKPIVSTKGLSSMIAAATKPAATKTVTTAVTTIPLLGTTTQQKQNVTTTPAQTTISGTWQITGYSLIEEQKQDQKQQNKLRTGTRTGTMSETKTGIGQIITPITTPITTPIQITEPGQTQRTRQDFRFTFPTPVPPPPPGVGTFPLLLFGGIPKSKKKKRKRSYSMFESWRMASYKPSIIGITLKPKRFKPKKFFTGLEVRRVRKRRVKKR